MKKYVSGIRPSGKLHLGNYLGAIKHWKELYKEGNCYFFVADMYGQYKQKEIHKTREALCALSIDARLQSHFYPELLELQHELSFYAKTSRLDNMTQFKEKGGTLALYSYPVLMAADILYHEATHVPVGEDQKQHLELVRELARATCRKEPEAVINPVGARIMDLRDQTKKMSKSNPNPEGIIYLCDSKDDIARKVKAAVSDAAGIDNLLQISWALGGKFDYTGRNVDLKNHVTELLINEFDK